MDTVGCTVIMLMLCICSGCAFVWYWLVSGAFSFTLLKMIDDKCCIWSKPIEQNKSSKISCNFQDGLCDWSIQRNGSCIWTKATGSISLNTGNSQGSTRLIASDLHLEHNSCLTINVFERGNVMRNCIEAINIVSIKNGHRSILAFTITLLRTNYNEVKIKVPASSNLGIAIEASCIWYCYLQINDIALKAGPCNRSVEFKAFTIRASKISCNFQDGLCDWSIQRNGHCSWTETTGFISLNTGNSQGFTQLTASDIHLEHDSCLTINVYERGNAMRNCIEAINIVSFKKGHRSILAFTITLLRTNYNEVKIEVPASSNFDIAIEARCIWYCYLQINDIALKRGPCNSSVELKAFTIRAYSTTYNSQEMRTVQHTSVADQISKRQTYFIIGEYAGMGVAALVVVCLFAIFVFVYKRREKLKKSNDRCDVGNTAAVSRAINRPIEANQTQNPRQRNAYSQLQISQVTKLSNQYDEINMNLQCNAESVSNYNYIDFENEAKDHDTNLANSSVRKTSDPTDDKINWQKQHEGSEYKDITRKVNPALLNETSGGYAILNPQETGYNRSIKHETNDVPISSNSDKKTDMQNTIDHNGYYSLINDGIYMTIDNAHYIDTDANIYNMCVDNV